ncbi:MAG TPA: hypothetical protein VG498_22885, partial [Terriglobales bacterium]|nr:hypothetical protein [Terriglobales bacterium]
LSPHGDVVRFTQYHPKTMTGTLWEVSSKGVGLRPLFPNWTNASTCCGDWMAGGRYFVFRVTTHEEGWDTIWICQESGRVLHRVNPRPMELVGGGIDFYNLTVSKDGSRLYALGLQPRNRPELQRFDVQNSEFVPYLKGIPAQVSILGDQLAYVPKPEGIVFSSRLDGSQKLQLTSDNLLAEFPRVSPDGQRVAFMAAPPHGTVHIYLVPFHGGDVQQVSFGDTAEGYPDWSPDGSQLVLSGLPEYMDESQAKPIQVLDLRNHRTSPIPGSEGLVCPRWSPDGRYVAAKSADSKRLMLYEFATQRWTQLVNLSINFLNWSHDGRLIYFDTYPGDAIESGLYRVRVASGSLERITDLKTMRQAPGFFYQYWTGLAPDDSPLFLRQLSTEELYAIHLQMP